MKINQGQLMFVAVRDRNSKLSQAKIMEIEHYQKQIWKL